MVERYVAWGTESAYGTPVAATVYKDVLSESMRMSKGYFFKETVRGRYSDKKLTGPKAVGGDISMLLATEPDAYLMYYALGAESHSTLETGCYEHLLTGADTIPSFTMRVGAEKNERIIPGCLVQRLTIEGVAGEGPLVMSCGIIGANETTTTIGSPTFSTVRELNFNETEVKIGGSARDYVKAFRVTVGNAIATDRMYSLGTSDAELMVRSVLGTRTVDGSLDLQFDDLTEYNRFLATTDFAINMKATGELCGATKYHSVEIDLPKCIYTSDTTPNIVRRDPIRLTAPFKAMFDSSSTYDIEITVQNSIADLAP